MGLGSALDAAGTDRVGLPVDDNELAVLLEHEVDATGRVALGDTQGVRHLCPPAGRSPKRGEDGRVEARAY